MRTGMHESMRTLRWLSGMEGPDVVAEAIRRAWSASAILASYAGGITKATPWDQDCDLLIRVECDLGAGVVCQYAPLRNETLDPAARSLLSDRLRDLICAAPGFRHDAGELLSLNSIGNPPTQIRRWCDGYLRGLLRTGALQSVVLHVATTMLGDMYVMNRGGELLFFDHEEPSLLRCGFSADEVAELYVLDCERIIEPSDLGEVTVAWTPTEKDFAEDG